MRPLRVESPSYRKWRHLSKATGQMQPPAPLAVASMTAVNYPGWRDLLHFELGDVQRAADCTS